MSRRNADKHSPAHAGVHCRVAVGQAHAHLFDITLTVAAAARRQTFALPVWIPGSYLVREFSQHLQQLTATSEGRPVALRQLDKHRWQADNEAGASLSLSYRVYAFDASVRTAFLDGTRGFFNSTSTCLRVIGQEDRPHTLEVARGTAPVGWRVATGLEADPGLGVDADGWGTYRAADYDELVDCPVELGSFWSGEFEACGVPHRFVVSGAGAWFDGQRLLDDTRRICETQIRFWHGDQPPPFQRYVFMLHASADGYGGLEHRNSTALICQRADLPRQDDKPRALKATDGYTTLLGLISHEYFHTWNVKRLRPAEFARYDYDQENHTELLWFFEGFTSYYDDLFLRRAGLIDDNTWLQLQAKNINQLRQTPGRLVQTVAQASFDAWVKYYRVGENTPNATVSYYGKGALVALCLDLTLRQRGSSLDDAMRTLWARTEGGPMREADVRRVLKQLAGRNLDAELDAWVHSTAELPVESLLQATGVKVQDEPVALAQQLGLRVSETGGAVQVKTVMRGSAAEAAGLAAGDEWLGIELAPARRGQAAEAWRIAKLDEVAWLRGKRSGVTALVSRDRRLLRCPLEWPPAQQAVKLSVQDAAAVARWLAG
jgi:predicted metalloprotease with PDZ domain